MEWDELPELLTLAEVARLIRRARQTCWNQLCHDRFPIAHIPDARPYLFIKANVRAYVERG